MDTRRIRIISADIIKTDLARAMAFVAYTLRSPLGDNQSATDLRIVGVEEMIDELFESARNKAALLAQVFSGQKVAPDSFEMSDSRYTRDRLTPLFSRLLEAHRSFQTGHLGEAELTSLETDGVHLLRPELDVEGKSAAERVGILRRRAEMLLKQSDPQTARLMVQRALRLSPDDAESQQILARCT